MDADVFRAVADPTRRELLDLLQAGDHTVNELVGRFRISQPAISRHLRILRSAGLVRSRAVGRRRWYRLEAKPIEKVYEWSARYVSDPFGHVWRIRERSKSQPSKEPNSKT